MFVLGHALRAPVSDMIEDEKLKTMQPTRETRMNEAALGMVLEIGVAFPVRN